MSHLVLTLLFIALDPSSSDDVKREVVVAVDSICNSLDGDNNANPTTVRHETCPLVIALSCHHLQEISLCTALVKFASTLAPINQVQVISFFSGGCGRSRIIARRIAHTLLVAKPHVSLVSYIYSRIDQNTESPRSGFSIFSSTPYRACGSRFSEARLRRPF